MVRLGDVGVTEELKTLNAKVTVCDTGSVSVTSTVGLKASDLSFDANGYLNVHIMASEVTGYYDPRGSTGSYGAVSIGTTATSIIAANTNRKGYVVQNLGPDKLYIGFDANVTSDNGIEVPVGGVFAGNDYTGDLYGISAGTSDVRYMEIT